MKHSQVGNNGKAMDRALSSREAMERLHVCNTTLMRLLTTGKLRGSRMIRNWRISENSVDEFIAGGQQNE